MLLYRVTLTDAQGTVLDRAYILDQSWYVHAPLDYTVRLQKPQTANYTVAVCAENAYEMQSQPLICTAGNG